MPPQPSPQSSQSPSDTHLYSRVDRVEASVNGLHEDFAGIKSDVRSLAGSVSSLSTSVSSGFDSMRKETASSKQTNWGWIAAFVGVGVAIMGYTTSALVEPLKTKDVAIEGRISDLKDATMRSLEQAIRNDERIKTVETRLGRSDITPK